jgi:predicted HD phosphohydrolase
MKQLADVDALLGLLASARRAFDEPGLDVLSHSLQCAALLADEGADDELVAAGLVHDVADAAYPTDHTHHDRRGAELVEPVLGPRVARLVRGHVLAKRYLVTVEPDYRSQLSAVSTLTLSVQGDTLDADAVAAFEADPNRDALVALRRADDRAKANHPTVPGLYHWQPLLSRVAAGRR